MDKNHQAPQFLTANVGCVSVFGGWPWWPNELTYLTWENIPTTITVIITTICEEHPISCPHMEIMKTTFYSAIVTMKGEPNYWDILPEALNKTLYVKSPFNQIQWTASHMEKRGTVDQGKTGCITPKNIYTKKNCISLTMKRPFKRMHVYSMQPMLDTFNKAGTFGYAYALLPLLTCRRSRVGQQKKQLFVSHWHIDL